MIRGARFGRVAGIDLVADWSLVVIFALVAASLGGGALPRWHPDWSPALVWAVALIAAVLFFASILVHELAHALVARGRGVPVDRITLFIFGGVSRMRREPERARDELAIAIAGPLASVVIGVIFTLLGAALVMDAVHDGRSTAEVVKSMSPAATVLLWLGPINVALGLFNLIPGFPLDGGRVLRAVLWSISGDLERATRWSARVGRLLAFVMMAFGALMIIGGNLLQGLWLVLIGWFLDNAALLGRRQQEGRAALVGVPVSAVMQRRFDSVTPGETVTQLVDDHMLRGAQRSFPVVDHDELIGMVSIADLRRAPRERWRVTTVADVMTPVESLAIIDPDRPAFEALERLGEREVAQLPVVDMSGDLVGLVYREDVVRWLALRAELRKAHRP